ncbi:MAG TPA: hypothetical protein VG942_19155 [Hyphomonadaceae bacterium]|nr:hypothetical protein [Hyphomonadaceae bacterium]
MEQLVANLSYVLNGAAGAVLAPLVAGLIGGRGLGSVPNILAGMAAGFGVGFLVDAFGYGNLLGSAVATPELRYVQDLFEGAIGGALIGVVLGFIRRH